MDNTFIDTFWDPFGYTDFDTSDPSRRAARNAQNTANTRADWLETSRAHVFKVDMPGVKKEDMKVEIEDGKTLRISGEREQAQNNETDKWHRLERAFGGFLKMFRLPETSNVENTSAHVEHGVLTVTVPKDHPKPDQARLSA